MRKVTEMNPESELVEAVEGMVHLCDECDEALISSWFGERLGVFRMEAKDSEVYQKALCEIKNIFGGMGSFSDLVFIPCSLSSLSLHEARVEQWALIRKLDASISALFSKPCEPRKEPPFWVQPPVATGRRP